MTKGDKNVLRTLVNNPGATISEPSFGLLVHKCVGDDWLSECVAGERISRNTIFVNYSSRASDIVRQSR